MSTIITTNNSLSVDEHIINEQTKSLNEFKKDVTERQANITMKAYKSALETLRTDGVAIRQRFDILIKAVDGFDVYGPAHPQSKALKKSYEDYKRLADESRALFNSAMDRAEDLAKVDAQCIRDHKKSLYEKRQNLDKTRKSILNDRENLLSKKRAFISFRQNTLKDLFEDLQTDEFPAKLQEIYDRIEEEENALSKIMVELRRVINASGNRDAKRQLQYATSNKAKDWTTMRSAVTELLDTTRFQVEQSLLSTIAGFLTQAEKHWSARWKIQDGELTQLTVIITTCGVSPISDQQLKAAVKAGDNHNAKLKDLQEHAELGTDLNESRQIVMKAVGTEIGALRAGIQTFDNSIDNILDVFNVLTKIIDYITESIRPDPFIESLLTISDEIVTSFEKESQSILVPVKA